MNMMMTAFGRYSRKMRWLLMAGKGGHCTGRRKYRNGFKTQSQASICIQTSAAAQRGGEWVLETVVTGDFKASPARFEYFITLDRDKISSLRVEFRGSLKS
jgi:hypothetical protein